MRSWAVVMLIGMAAGCSRRNEILCMPGASVACACTNGASGAQVCDDQGHLGECRCDGRVGVGGGAGSGGAGGGDASGGGGTGGGGGGDDAPPPPMSTPGGPQVLSFKASTSTLTEGLAVTFTAILTHPAGVEALTGGTLTTPDGSLTYGQFGPGGPQGAYALQLSWAQLQQTLPVDFIQKDARSFTGVFYDASGRKATASVVVTLTCGGNPCCGGKCIHDQESLPPTCRLQYVSSPTPTSCTSLCATKSRGCSSECSAGYPDSWAALVVYGNQQVTPSKDCAAVPAATVPDGIGGSMPFTVMSCCCF